MTSSAPVSELLRRCQLFAARVGVPELGEWVRLELNGYPPDAELPSYRVVYGAAKGHFLGPFGSGLRYAILPASNLPKECRDWARKASLRQPIVALEEIARDDSESDTVSFPWPGDLVARVQGRFYEHLNLGQAWLEVSRTDFVSAVEAVRNRILSFAIDAERYVKDDGVPLTPERTSALSHVFHTHIYGSVGNLAQGGSDFTQNAGLAPGDLEALLRELRILGVPQEDLSELKDAVAADGQPQAGKIGTRVARWLGGMVGKAMTGAWGIASSTATAVLPKMIQRYYGIDS